MEEKTEMMYKIIGLLIGLLIFGAGIYYLIKEKNDPSSRKIYAVFTGAGAFIAIVCGILLFI